MSDLKDALEHAVDQLAPTDPDNRLVVDSDFVDRLFPHVLAKLKEGENGSSAFSNVKRVGEIRAGGLKVAAYRVMDVETGAWGRTQFHMTWDNFVMAVMGEEGAKLFSNFVQEHLGRNVEGTLIEYPTSEDFDLNAPENRLRRVLSNTEAPAVDHSALENVIRTAVLGGVLPASVDWDTAVTIYRLVSLVSKLDTTEHLHAKV